MTSPANALRQTSDNLVVTRAGPSSLHRGWLAKATPDFDLVVTAYSPDAPVADGEQRVAIEGRKVAGYGRFFQDHPEVLDKYAVIALIDDDIDTDADSINRCLAIGRARNFRIWQPSLSPNSYFTYGITLSNPLLSYRVTDYVEMMCPFFTADALRHAMELFHSGSETGIDLVWSQHPRFADAPCAIIDEVAVEHTRPVGTTKHMQGFRRDEAYTDQMHEILDRYGMSFNYPSNLHGRTRIGNVFIGKSVTDLLQVNIFGSAFYGKHTKKYVARAYYHHLKRIFAR